MKRRVGILLAGCGAYDGTDPQEAILTMLAVQEAGLEVVPLAVQGPQFHVVDHTTAQETEGVSREMMVEAARLVRGKLYLLEEISPKLLDALVIPGGQGVVKSVLSGFDGSGERTVPLAITDFIQGVHSAGGAIGAISLAEFLVRDVLGPWPEDRGCFDIPADGILLDPVGRKVLTPGYTLATSLPQLFAGVKSMISALVELIEQRD